MTSLPLGERHATAAPSRSAPGVDGRALALSILLTVLLFGTATFGFYRRDLISARSSTRLGSTVLQTSCGSIEYAARGSGPPVLAIHGTGGGWDQGLFIGRGLIDRGYRVIAPSRYGYLRTPMPDNASPQTEADFMTCFLDAMKVDKAAVIAASAGASPALQLALQHPERVSSLILLVPAIGGISPPDTEALVSPFIMNVVLGSDFFYWAAMKAWPKASLTVVAVPESLVPTLAAEDKANLNQAISSIMPVTWRRKGILYDANNQSTEQPYALETITVPTLLVSAEDDLYQTLPNARVAASRIPGARLMQFATGGHLLLGHDEEIWPAVAAFIDGSGYQPTSRVVSSGLELSRPVAVGSTGRR